MKNPLFADLEELTIVDSDLIEKEVADKLYQFHIIPMDKVRKKLDVWITASLKSGYRPKWWELLQGRNGSSQHTFKDNWEMGSGAVDWTCENFEKNKDELLRLIIENTDYTRICIYDNFLHCDYKDVPKGKRQLFEFKNGKWKFKKFI